MSRSTSIRRILLTSLSRSVYRDTYLRPPKKGARTRVQPYEKHRLVLVKSSNGQTLSPQTGKFSDDAPENKHVLLPENEGSFSVQPNVIRKWTELSGQQNLAQITQRSISAPFSCIKWLAGLSCGSFQSKCVQKCSK